MKKFKVEITRLDGSQYYNTFSTEEEADRFTNKMLPKVLAVSPVEKITTEKDVFTAMLDAVESRM